MYRFSCIFRAVNGNNSSKINLSSGTINNANINHTSTMSITGGTVTNQLKSFGNGIVNISGGDVCTAGVGRVSIESFDTSTINISGGRSGTMLIRDNSQVNISGGLVDGPVNFYDASTGNITGGNVGIISRGGSGTTTISGTASVVSVGSNDTSTVNIGGNAIVTNASSGNNSTLNITGGKLEKVDGYGNSTINISGGSVFDPNPHDHSHMHITGGIIGHHTIRVFDYGIVDLFGTGFSLTFSSASSDAFGSYNDYILSGFLQDGASIDGVHFHDYDGGFQIGDPNNPNGANSPLNFNPIITSAAPEPGTLPLLLSACLLVGLSLRRWHSASK